MAMYAKVRRMRLRDGLSISEIARRTSLARNTIKTWLRTPVRSEMTYQRAAGPKKIGPLAMAGGQAFYPACAQFGSAGPHLSSLTRHATGDRPRCIACPAPSPCGQGPTLLAPTWARVPLA